MYRGRGDMRYSEGWVLYHERGMCGCWRSYILGVYPAGSDEAAGATAEGLEAG